MTYHWMTHKGRKPRLNWTTIWDEKRQNYGFYGHELWLSFRREQVQNGVVSQWLISHVIPDLY